MTPEERRIQEAKDPTTSPERLAELSKDSTPGVASWVAQNPNTPDVVLLQLAEKYPKEFIENPYTILLLLERPGLLEQLSLYAILAIIRQEAVPVSWLQIVANYPNESVQTSLAKHPSTPHETLLLLAKSKFWRTQAAITKRQDLSLAALRLCAESHWLTTLEGVASHPNATAELLSPLLENQEPSVRKAAARHPNAPLERLSQLRRAGASEHLEYLIDGDPLMTPEELAALGRRRFFARQLAARHPASPLITQRALLKDQNPEVRGSLASSPSLPEELLESLAQDPTPHVRGCVAKNPRTPARVLLSFQASKEDDLVKLSLAQNLLLPPEIFFSLIASPPKNDYSFLHALRQNPQVPSEILRRLAFTSQAELRAVASQHPNTEEELKRTFLKAGTNDDFSEPSKASRQHPTLTEDEVSLLMRGYFGRLLLLRNPFTKAKHLEQILAKAKNEDEAFEHTLLQQKSRNYYSEGLFLPVLLHPNITQEILSLAWQEHRAVYGVTKTIASHPKTSTQTLNALIEESGHLWGEDLLRNPNLSPEQKTKLALLPKQSTNIRSLLLQQTDLEEALLVGACSADDVELRRLALSHPKLSKSYLALFHRVGASNDLFWFQAPDPKLSPEDLLKVLTPLPMGSYLREVIARHPSTTREQLDTLLTPSELQQVKGEPHKIPIRLAHALACNPKISPEIAQSLEGCLDPMIEEALWLHQKRGRPRPATLLSSAVDVLLPQLQESFTEGAVAAVSCYVGQAIKLDESLFEIETDCMNIDLPSPCNGLVAGIFVQPNEIAKVGQRLAVIYRTVTVPPQDAPHAGTPLHIQKRQNFAAAWYREKTTARLPSYFFQPKPQLDTPRYSALSVHPAFLPEGARSLLWTDSHEVIHGEDAFTLLLQREQLIGNAKALSAQLVARLFAATEEANIGEVICTIREVKAGLHPPMLIREDQGNRWVFWTKSQFQLRCWCLWLEERTMRHREIVAIELHPPEDS